MPKPQIEFTHISTLTSEPLTPLDPPRSGNATIRVLSHDAETGDQTSVLTHPPGSSWGAPVCLHDYWEEAYILEGRIYDETLQKWFEKGSFCCRPPYMKHGPYKADPEAGCEEICYWRYPKKAEKGLKILQTTMRKSLGLSAVGPRSQTEQLALETQSVEEPQENTQINELKGSSTISPLSPKRQSRLAAYRADVERRWNAGEIGQSPVEESHENEKSIEQSKGDTTPSPLSPKKQSRLAAFLNSEEKRPKVEEGIGGTPAQEPREITPTIEQPRSNKLQGPLTPKRQSRLAAYLANEEKRPKADENGARQASQPASPPSPSGAATPPRQSRLAAYRAGVWSP
jgi:hypothetical protein